VRIPLRQYGRLLGQYLRPLWWPVVLLAILLFTGIGLQLVNPQIMRRFIDVATLQAEDAGAGAALLRNALLFLGLALVQQVVSVLAAYVSENVGWSATNALRADLARHCIHLDMSFHNAHTPGEMIERIDGDVTALTNFFSQFVIRLVSSALLLAGMLLLLFREDWRVGLVMSTFSLVTLFLLARFRDIAVPHWKAERQASAELFGFLEERLAATEDIRANGARAYVMHHFYRLQRELMRRSLKAALMINILLNSSFFLFTVGNATAFALGAWLYGTGDLTIGAVYLVVFYTNMLERPIRLISRQLEDLQRAAASLVRVQEMLAIESRIQVAPEPVPLPAGALAVEFQSVSFGYAAEKELQADEPPETAGDKPRADPEEAPDPAQDLVLQDLTFRLAPGTVLGLLGRTGSGKTTLTRLLFRLWDPEGGAVRLGGGDTPDRELADVRQVDLVDLRRRVGMVTQNIQLFHATVRDNLTFFDDSIPDERILAVIQDLGLAEWLQSLPQGLDSELESGGGGLSAGEAQLLAFTRIFLQDPGLVILDEASSRLDPATESLIELAVARLVRQRTAIIIAHRLGTVQRADEIMILEEGRIGEYGPRLDLVADPASRFNQLLRTGLEEVLV
jgi:ATP-binding cassette subfamily B protein